MSLVPVREFSSAAEMRAHGRRVMAKAYNPAPKPQPAPLARDHSAEIASLCEIVAGLKDELTALQREVSTLRKVQNVSPKAPVDILDLVTAACATFDATYADVMSERRSSNALNARFAIYYLSKELTPHSLTTIGATLKKDHSTVIHGLRKAQALMEKDRDFAAKVEETRERASGRKSKRERIASMRRVGPLKTDVAARLAGADILDLWRKGLDTSDIAKLVSDRYGQMVNEASVTDYIAQHREQAGLA